ncbi:MAG: RluA family pseudouridine synthase [Bacteriovoracia bacterium]
MRSTKLTLFSTKSRVSPKTELVKPEKNAGRPAPRILFEDTHLVVLSKPAGLLSQGEHTGDENLVDWLRGHFGRNYVGLVHRLDRNTSGLMVVAKRTKSAQRLTQALQTGKICRSYLAWLSGSLPRPVCWTHWLSKDGDSNTVRVVAPHSPGAKAALLNARPRRPGTWEGSPITLMEIELDTGRSHQIRVQAASEGHPLVGDAKYGSALRFHRPALHSFRIRFSHPMSGEELEFVEEFPGDWPTELKEV